MLIGKFTKQEAAYRGRIRTLNGICGARQAHARRSEGQAGLTESRARRGKPAIPCVGNASHLPDIAFQLAFLGVLGFTCSLRRAQFARATTLGSLISRP